VRLRAGSAAAVPGTTAAAVPSTAAAALPGTGAAAEPGTGAATVPGLAAAALPGTAASGLAGCGAAGLAAPWSRGIGSETSAGLRAGSKAPRLFPSGSGAALGRRTGLPTLRGADAGAIRGPVARFGSRWGSGAGPRVAAGNGAVSAPSAGPRTGAKAFHEPGPGSAPGPDAGKFSRAACSLPGCRVLGGAMPEGLLLKETLPGSSAPGSTRADRSLLPSTDGRVGKSRLSSAILNPHEPSNRTN
jgi:hypothetical protein